MAKDLDSTANHKTKAHPHIIQKTEIKSFNHG